MSLQECDQWEIFRENTVDRKKGTTLTLPKNVLIIFKNLGKMFCGPIGQKLILWVWLHHQNYHSFVKRYQQPDTLVVA